MYLTSKVFFLNRKNETGNLFKNIYRFYLYVSFWNICRHFKFKILLYHSLKYAKIIFLSYVIYFVFRTLMNKWNASIDDKAFLIANLFITLKICILSSLRVLTALWKIDEGILNILFKSLKLRILKIRRYELL